MREREEREERQERGKGEGKKWGFKKDLGIKVWGIGVKMNKFKFCRSCCKDITNFLKEWREERERDRVNWEFFWWCCFFFLCLCVLCVWHLSIDGSAN